MLKSRGNRIYGGNRKGAPQENAVRAKLCQVGECQVIDELSYLRIDEFKIWQSGNL